MEDVYTFRFYEGVGFLVSAAITVANSASLWIKYKEAKNRNIFLLLLASVVTVIMTIIWGVGGIGLDVGFISAEQLLVTGKIGGLALFLSVSLANYVVIGRMFVFDAPTWLKRSLHVVNGAIAVLGTFSGILYLTVSDDGFKAASFQAERYLNLAILGFRIISNFAINLTLVRFVYRINRNVVAQSQSRGVMEATPAIHGASGTASPDRLKELISLNRRFTIAFGVSVITEFVSVGIFFFRDSLPPYLGVIYAVQVGLHLTVETALQYSIRTFRRLTNPKPASSRPSAPNRTQV